MLSLFNLLPGTNIGTVQPQNWASVKAVLRQNLGTITSYYRRNPMAVKADHFLVRLLQSIAVPMALEVRRYYYNVDDITSSLSMALKMTSPIYQGRLFRGTFYGPGCDEILIAVDEPFDYEDADRNWMNLQPVRVLRHPRSDLELILPDGSASSSEKGLAVIAINIPMLAIMYRGWTRENQYYASISGESPRSIMQFIHTHVLPSMMPSHLDCVLFNRLHCLQVGLPLGHGEEKHPFPLVNIAQRMNAIHDTVLDNLDKNRVSFTTALRMVPLVSQNTLNDHCDFPQVSLTRQVTWAMSIALFPYIDFMLRVHRFNPNTTNQQEINKMLRVLNNLRGNNIYQNALPPHVRDVVFGEIDELRKLAG